MKTNQQAARESLSGEIVMERVVEKPGGSIFDQIGVILSAICLVHCVLTPIILVSLPLADAFIGDEWFHRIMLAIILPIASFAFFSGVRQHGDRRVLGLGLLGLGLIATGTFVAEGFLTETLPTIVGSLLLVSAHLMNRRLCLNVCRVQTPSHCCYKEL